MHIGSALTDVLTIYLAALVASYYFHFVSFPSLADNTLLQNDLNVSH